MSADSLTVEIVTPTAVEESRQVSYVRAPGFDGLFGVMAGHIRAMIALGIGEISIQQRAGRRFWATSGGYAEVHPDRVVLLIETAELAQDIDTERAHDAASRARNRLQQAKDNPDIDRERARKALRKATNRIAVAERI